MAKTTYKKRISDAILERKLQTIGAVMIEGPKWCGKTTTAEQHANSILYVSAPDLIRRNMILAETNISALLQGKTPRLLDEWQVIPQLWDAIRYEVDHRDGVGHFIITGSSVPPSDNELGKIHHTGTGRIARFRMRTMSLLESGESNGEISLECLFENPNRKIFAESNLLIEDVAYLICRGGWPSATLLDKKYALETAVNYYDAVTEVDISRIDGTKRNPERTKRLMRSLSRHQGAQVSVSALKADMISNDTNSLDDDTVASYISALKKIFVIEDMEAWNPNLRSKTAIRSSDTRYFTDPSVAVSALGVGPKDLVNDLNTMGLFFETLAVRDLRVYAEALGGNVYHYRDGNGLECDAVIHLRNGNYGLVEIKLGGERLVVEGAKNLLSLEKKIDTTKMPAPSFKMVLTAVGNVAYLREDGVYVVPIGCLGV